MNRKNTKCLLKRYSALYRQHSLPMGETCMCWLFTCGDGWYSLVDKLSKQLTDYATKHKIVVEAVQVKEKFGSMRFYVGGVDAEHYDVVHKLIDAAERESARTCEVCGKPGRINSTGWASCLCKKCRADKKAGQ